MISGSFKDMIQHFLAHPELIAFFLLLIGATLGLWMAPAKKIWFGFLILTLIFGLVFGKITIVGFSCLAILGMIVFGYYHWLSKPSYRLVGGTLLFILSVGFYVHMIPGFSNMVLIPAHKITQDAFPYRSFLNFDKVLAGLFFMGFGLQLARSTKDWMKAFVGALIPTFLTVSILLSFALTFNYVGWSPKLPGITFVWVISNFLFVAIAEEALFRGFLQTELQKIIGGKSAVLWGLLLSSVFYGLLHYKGGLFYISFATIAGLGYGTTYLMTKRIESAILSHFIINLIHFLFFTYPLKM